MWCLPCAQLVLRWRPAILFTFELTWVGHTDFTAAGMTLTPRRSTVDSSHFDAQMTCNCNLNKIPSKPNIKEFSNIHAVNKAMPSYGFGAGIYNAHDDTTEDDNSFPGEVDATSSYHDLLPGELCLCLLARNVWSTISVAVVRLHSTCGSSKNLSWRSVHAVPALAKHLIAIHCQGQLEPVSSPLRCAVCSINKHIGSCKRLPSCGAETPSSCHLNTFQY